MCPRFDSGPCHQFSGPRKLSSVTLAKEDVAYDNVCPVFQAIERPVYFASKAPASFRGVDDAAVSNILTAVEITFQVEPCNETGGFVARWDDPQGGGITTQGDTLANLQSMVADAVSGYFEAGQVPAKVRLHFRQDPLVAVA